MRGGALKPTARPIRLLAALIALLFVAACSTAGKSSSTLSAGKEKSGSTTEAESTDTSARTDDAVDEEDGESEDAPSSKSSSKAKIEVVEAGFTVYKGYDDAPRATAAAVLENSGDDMATFFEVIFVFKDADGKPVGTQSTYAYAVEGGGTGYTGVSSVDLTGEVDTINVSAVFDPDGFSFGEGTVVPVTVESVKPEEYGDGVEVRGIAENPTDEILEMVEVSCALRSSGEIVGYASGYLDTMVAGGSVSWTASGWVGADAADCYGSRHG